MNHPNPDDRTLIFDCDGVLVDSEAVVIEIESALLTEAGFPITTDEVAETCVGLNYADMMALLAERFGKPVPEELNAKIQADALAAFPSQLKPVPGIDQLLAENTLPRCVASSSDLDRVNLSLGLTDLDRHFTTETIFSSQMVQRGKPAPDLFLHAAAQLSAPPERCVVVEDSPHGVTAAIAAGMQVIGFVGGGHARPSLTSRLRAAGATEIADTAAELSAFLDKR